MNKLILLALFMLPVGVVVGINWQQISPYVLGDPELTDGYLLYLYAPT